MTTINFEQRMDRFNDLVMERWREGSQLYWAGFHLRNFRKHRDKMRDELLANGADEALLDDLLDEQEQQLRDAIDREKEALR